MVELVQDIKIDNQIQLAAQEVMKLMGWENANTIDPQLVIALGKVLNEDPVDVYTRGYEAWQQEDYPRALLNFIGLVMLQPTNWHVYVALAGALRMIAEYKLAIDFYAYALCLDVQNPEPTYQIAICLYALGCIDEAREALQSAIDMSYFDPNYSQIRANAESMLLDIV